MRSISARSASDSVRKPLEAITQYAAQQRLIPRAYAVEELFDDTTRLLS